MSEQRANALAEAFFHNGMNKTKALEIVGDSDPNRNCTRAFASPVVQAKLKDVEERHLAALGKVKLTPEAWASGLKKGIARGNPGALRLYAEVVKLVGEQNAQTVIPMVIQIIGPVFLARIPDAEKPALRAELRKLLATHDDDAGI